MFDAIQVRVVTNQIKGACNRIDMLLSDLDTLADSAKTNGKEINPHFIEALEDQVLGQVADLQQLVLGMTMVIGSIKDKDEEEDKESEKFEIHKEKSEEDEGEGSAFQARELVEQLAKKKEDEHARRIEQRM